MAEHKFLVVLKEKTSIPPEAVKMNSIETSQEFADPWQNGWQEKSGFPKPPMEVHNSYYDNTQLEVRHNGQMLRISVEGEICIDPNYGVDAKKIKRMIEILPSLWKWGVEVRRLQDEIFAKIVTLLPDWEIIFPEDQRTFFSGEILKRIENLLAKFKQASEKIPTVQKCTVKEVIPGLEKAWENTRTQEEVNKKVQEKQEKEEEEYRKERDKKREARKKETEKILQKAGLL